MNDLLYTLALTILLEQAVAYLIFMRSYNLRVFVNVALINVLTNLPLNYIIYMGYYNKLRLSINQYLTICEILIVVVEAFLYHYSFDLDYKKSFLISLSANVISFVIGGILINL